MKKSMLNVITLALVLVESCAYCYTYNFHLYQLTTRLISLVTKGFGDY